MKLPDEGRVTVRLSHELRADLQGFATAQGIGMAEAVRRVLVASRGQMQGAIAGHARQQAQRRYVVLTEASFEVLDGITNAVEGARLDWLRIGSNVNQLAARANSGVLPLASEVEQLRAEVRTARAELAVMGRKLADLVHDPDALYRAAHPEEVRGDGHYQGREKC